MAKLCFKSRTSHLFKMFKCRCCKPNRQRVKLIDGLLSAHHREKTTKLIEICASHGVTKGTRVSRIEGSYKFWNEKAKIESVRCLGMRCHLIFMLRVPKGQNAPEFR